MEISVCYSFCCCWVPRPFFGLHSTRGTGMNQFLNNLEITFRRDPSNYRPRINKMNSTKDREQKLAGTFFYLDE